MGRNIVICCDGTANEFAATHTNVVKFYTALVHGSEQQLTLYYPGVGTRDPPHALTTWGADFSKFLGQAIGYGVLPDIIKVYTFVMQTYRPDDRLFMFGFSRGAYTIRAVASLLHQVGILRSGHDDLVSYVLRSAISPKWMEMRLSGKKNAVDFAKQWLSLMDRYRSTFSAMECKPHFVGLWDTVSSIGWKTHPLKIPFTSGNPSVQIAREALALDERRAFYQPLLWGQSHDPAADVKLVWFAGNHCDVGGGYDPGEEGLSKISLAWMFREAEAAGLLVDSSRKNAVLSDGEAPDPNARMHDELHSHPCWYLAEILPRYHINRRTWRASHAWNLARRRYVPPNSLIHKSVFERVGYSPNLPAEHRIEE